MINIHLLRESSEETPVGSLVLKHQDQYPAIRKQIHDILAQNQECEIYVLTRVCDDWFWDLSDYHHEVRLFNDSSIERLKRKLSVDSLPADLMPETILGLELLNLSNPAEPISDVWMWIIRHKLGDLWTIREPGPEHFAGILNWYTDKTVHPLLEDKVNELAKSWVHLSSGKLKSAYALLFEDPTRNAHLLLALRALLLYTRELREQWLEAEGWYSPKFESIIDLFPFPNKLPASIRVKLNPKLVTHWNTQLKET